MKPSDASSTELRKAAAELLDYSEEKVRTIGNDSSSAYSAAMVALAYLELAKARDMKEV